MNIYIFTKKEKTLKNVFPKNTQFLAPAQAAKHSPNDDSLSYIDITDLTSADLKKTLTQLKKSSKDIPWGIIDLKGAVNDPAVLFFDGFCDYIGPQFFKKSKSIDSKRLKEALLWRNAASAASPASAKENSKTTKSAKFLANGIKLPPANSFSSWKSINSGKTLPFYLLYCSLQGKTALDSRLGEKAFAQIHKRFGAHLNENFDEADGLLWMDSGKDCLFLLPPKQKSVESVIESCLRMIISAPLVTLETLGLSIPINFVLALHYGTLNYKPPGKTGTVVSDAVNFIFHLGAKKAEPGRITISGEIPEGSIPKSLEDIFVTAGEYEGRKIWHSKKFSYNKPWV